MKTCFLLGFGLLLSASVFPQKVGIGTTTPAFKLDVRDGSINTDSVYRIESITVLKVPGIGNLFIGNEAGRVNAGINNTFCGEWAGYSNTLGGYNSFFGQGAGYFNTTGGANSFFGQFAGLNNTGYENSFFGAGAGLFNTTGVLNSFFGRSAGVSNTEGYDNSFFGKDAGYSNTIGDYNSFFGVSAGYSNTEGYDNSFFGVSAGRSINGENYVGTRNTAVGYTAGFNSDSLTNAMALGHNAIATGSDRVRIGDFFISSIGGHVSWTSDSDGRFKYQVQEDVQGLAFIKKLRAVSYLFDIEALNDQYSDRKSETNNTSSLQNTNRQSVKSNRQTGFIAQEVEQAASELGFSFSGVDKPQSKNGIYGLRYADFVVPLVKAIQEQQVMIDQQNERIDQQQTEIDHLKKLVHTFSIENPRVTERQPK